MSVKYPHRFSPLNFCSWENCGELQHCYRKYPISGLWNCIASSHFYFALPVLCLEEVHEKPKKKKLKPQETLQENGMEDPPVSLPKTKKKKAPKEELASDLEEMATSSVSAPKRKKSSPKEEVARESEEAASPSTPKKERKL